MIFIGIDPGFTGAIAIYDPASGFLEVHDMPVAPAANGKTELHMRGVLNALEGDTGTVWLERVAARPGAGVTGMFRFGQQFGALEMAVTAQGHALRYAIPKEWKKHFKLSADKGVARGEAERRFPAHAHLFKRVKDDGRAEAALIALYGAEQAHAH